MTNGFRKIIKTESQPILIKAGTVGGTQIYFPDNQYIRNKKLMAINLTTNLIFDFGAQQFYTDGKAIINEIDAAQIYLTLESYSGVQYIRKKPILEFCPYNNLNGVGNIAAPGNFIGQLTNFPKSYIEIANGAPPVAVDTYVLFDIFFTEINPAVLKTQLGVEFKNKS